MVWNESEFISAVSILMQMFISPKSYNTCLFVLCLIVKRKRTKSVTFFQTDSCVWAACELQQCGFWVHNAWNAYYKIKRMQTPQKKNLHTLSYISHEFGSLFSYFFFVTFLLLYGECRNPAMENSRPVKRIMSTISKHSEEAEDDEICSGNLWIINEHFKWIPWK